MTKKKYTRLYTKAVIEALERYPHNSQLHMDMRKTFIERMMVIQVREHIETQKFLFQLAQMIAIILMILAIILL